MVRQSCSVLLGLALLLGSSAAASAEQPSRGKNDQSRRICRSVTPTGSRFTDRVCRTQAEWDRAEDKAQREAQDQQAINTARWDKPPEPR